MAHDKLGEFSAQVKACKLPLMTNVVLKSGILCARYFKVNYGFVLLDAFSPKISLYRGWVTCAYL